MNDRTLYYCVAASLLVHMLTIPTASLMIRTTPSTPVHVPIELVNLPRIERVKTPEALPRPTTPKPKAAKLTSPKLLSKPEGNTKEEIKEPEKLIEPLPRLASLPLEPGSVKGGWNIGERPSEGEGGAAGAGNLFSKGDVGIVDGSGLGGGGGGNGTAGLGRGAKGDGTSGGVVGSGDALSGLARPLRGYQVKPHYPESARRAGAQGVTLLKLRILETGKVGQVLIEQSAGHPDLDVAAADAVKKWLFDPARQGRDPVAVWVLLPVKFELN